MLPLVQMMWMNDFRSLLGKPEHSDFGLHHFVAMRFVDPHLSNDPLHDPSQTDGNGVDEV
jgi:hypothetical protein